MSGSNGIRIILWTFLIINKGAIVLGQTGGSNAVALIKGQAMLDCSVSSLATSSWIHTADGSNNPVVIAVGCSVTGNNAAYYRTEQPGVNICRLIIANVTMQQAGVYTCNDGLSTTYRSLVTVIDPVANVVVHNESAEVVDNDQLNISCSINYNGPSSPAPSLRPSPYWTTSPGQIFTSSTYHPSINVVTLIATVTVQKPTVPIFQCKTVFETTGSRPTSGYNPVSPSENFTVGATTERDVRYGPSTPTISHGIRSFTSNDGSICTLTTLTCSSMANPSPNYKWKDVTIGNQLTIGISGNVFAWAEDNRTYECTATNNIRNTNRSMSTVYTTTVSSSRPCVSSTPLSTTTQSNTPSKSDVKVDYEAAKTAALILGILLGLSLIINGAFILVIIRRNRSKNRDQNTKTSTTQERNTWNQETVNPSLGTPPSSTYQELSLNMEQPTQYERLAADTQYINLGNNNANTD